MLAKQYRLSPREIPFIAKTGKAKRGEHLTIKYVLDSGLEHPKFAISISKKVDKRAAIRNRIKRRIRASIAELIEQDTFLLGKYLILIHSPNLASKELSTTEVILQTI